MAPLTKLRIANVLMLAGLVPLLYGVWTMFSMFAYARQNKGEMGGSDAFLLMAILMVTYACSLVVSGLAALWSLAVAHRHPELHAPLAALIRGAVYISLLLPLLSYLAISFRVF